MTEKSPQRDKDHTGYAVVPAGLMNHALRHMTLAQLKVYLVLRSHLPNIRPARDRIARFCGWAKGNQVSDPMNELEYAGLISRQTRTGIGTEYTIPDDKEMDEPDWASVAEALEELGAMNRNKRRDYLAQVRANRQELQEDSSVGSLTSADDPGLTSTDNRGSTVTDTGGLTTTDTGESADVRHKAEEEQAQRKEEEKGKPASGPSPSLCASASSTNVQTTEAAEGGPPVPPARSGDDFHPQAASDFPAVVGPAAPPGPTPANSGVDPSLVPESDSDEHPSVIPAPLPSWCDPKLIEFELDDVRQNPLNGIAGWLTYAKMNSRRYNAVVAAARGKNWLPYRVKSAIFNVLMRYPRFREDEQKIMGTVHHIITDDPPEKYDTTCRLQIGVARDFEAALRQCVFTDREDPADNVMIKLLERYTWIVALHVDHDICDPVDFVLRSLDEGPKANPGPIRDRAPVAVRVQAIHDRMDIPAASALEIMREPGFGTLRAGRLDREWLAQLTEATPNPDAATPTLPPTPHGAEPTGAGDAAEEYLAEIDAHQQADRAAAAPGYAAPENTLTDVADPQAGDGDPDEEDDNTLAADLAAP